MRASRRECYMRGRAPNDDDDRYPPLAFFSRGFHFSPDYGGSIVTLLLSSVAIAFNTENAARIRALERSLLRSTVLTPHGEV